MRHDIAGRVLQHANDSVPNHLRIIFKVNLVDGRNLQWSKAGFRVAGGAVVHFFVGQAERLGRIPGDEGLPVVGLI